MVTREILAVQKLIKLTKSKKYIWRLSSSGYTMTYDNWVLLLATDAKILSIKCIDENHTAWYVPLLENDNILKQLLKVIIPITFQIESFLDKILQEKE